MPDPIVSRMSAVVAYGSFLIPAVFKSIVESRDAQWVLYGPALFYLASFIVNSRIHIG